MILSTEGQLKECSKEFPKFLVKPEPSVDIELGDELRLTCIGTGDICRPVNAPVFFFIEKFTISIQDTK